MSQHTPGPWGFYIEPDGDSPAVYIVDDHPTPHDIIRGESGFGLDTTRANARLIAAAPLMLDACRAALDLLPMCSCDNGVHSPSGDSEGEHWLRLLSKQLADAIAAAALTAPDSASQP